MGVHDYTCSICGTPGSYQCGEAEGGEAEGKACSQEGIGEDHAFVDLYFFSEGDAPEEPSQFEEKLPKALRLTEQEREYDWGEWEFVPSLNYRTYLMDDRDATGIWPVKPFEEHDDGSEIENLEIAEDERVWAVNYCPICRPLVKPTGAAPLDCKLYLQSISEHLEIPFEGDKAAFLATVRERAAKRRPPPRPESPRVIKRAKKPS